MSLSFDACWYAPLNLEDCSLYEACATSKDEQRQALTFSNFAFLLPICCVLYIRYKQTRSITYKVMLDETLSVCQPFILSFFRHLEKVLHVIRNLSTADILFIAAICNVIVISSIYHACSSSNNLFLPQCYDSFRYCITDENVLMQADLGAAALLVHSALILGWRMQAREVLYNCIVLIFFPNFILLLISAPENGFLWGVGCLALVDIAMRKWFDETFITWRTAPWLLLSASLSILAGIFQYWSILRTDQAPTPLNLFAFYHTMWHCLLALSISIPPFLYLRADDADEQKPFYFKEIELDEKRIEYKIIDTKRVFKL